MDLSVCASKRKSKRNSFSLSHLSIFETEDADEDEEGAEEDGAALLLCEGLAKATEGRSVCRASVIAFWSVSPTRNGHGFCLISQGLANGLQSSKGGAP
jgi:hypothetical protein